MRWRAAGRMTHSASGGAEAGTVIFPAGMKSLAMALQGRSVVVEKPSAESTGAEPSMPTQVMLAVPSGPATCLAYSAEPMSWVAVAWPVEEKSIIIAKAKKGRRCGLQLASAKVGPKVGWVVGPKGELPLALGKLLCLALLPASRSLLVHRYT